MSYKRRTLPIVFVLLLAVLLSACTQSLSSAPAKTPTVAVTGFSSPMPTGQNPMDAIAQFAAQTAAAQTAAAGGVPATPQPAAAALTPGVATTPAPVTPTNAAASVPTASGANPTAVPSGVRPATYTLQIGEFPYCIARRFNVDPDQLLSLSGMTSPDVYYPGQVLKIPQSGAFPGSRALLSHPIDYRVTSSDETLYSIACKYGDVDPAAIASLNGIAASAKLTAGQTIKIP